VKYRKNEAFVDVIETVNLMMSKDGKLLTAGGQDNQADG
jgi:AP-2 complex subunit mu-1